jgi:hypothetical protein
MESAFYPVITVENEEELEMVTVYCDEYKLEIQFLNEDLNKFPAQILLYVDREDFELFLDTINK